MKKLKNIFKKILIPVFVAAASFFLGRRRLKADSRPIKVNLGCGMLCLPDWINVDGSLTALLGSRWSWWNKFLYGLAGSAAFYSFEDFDRIVKNCHLRFFDLRRGVPLADNQADYVFASHILEHLTKKDGRQFLGECFRSLKPGGWLRLAVPDLDFAFKMYGEGKTAEMLDLFFYTSENYDFHMHKYNYNFPLLEKTLKTAGFSLVARRSYQVGECPDLGFLDIYPEHSLYVEAQKIK